jgi:nitrate reductase gamma subunit
MTSNDFLFRIWPYTALALCGAGLVVRAVLVDDRLPATRRAVADALASFVGGRLSRACLVALLGAHLVALVFPRAILAVNASPTRLVLLEATGVALGLGLLAAWGRALWRHVGRRRGSILLDLGDSIFLALLFVILSAGLLTALRYRWASSWGVATLTPWAVSLAQGRPDVGLVEHLPLFVRLHLFAALAAAAIFPFTRLGPLPIVIVHRALALAARPVEALARAVADWVRGRGLAARLWPEPEIRWIGQPASGDPTRGGEAPARRVVVPTHAPPARPLRQHGSKH